MDRYLNNLNRDLKKKPESRTRLKTEDPLVYPGDSLEIPSGSYGFPAFPASVLRAGLAT